MQAGAPVLEPGPVVEVVSPADYLALFIEVEHPHAGQLNAPAVAVEVPAVKPLGAYSVAPAEYVRQFPLDLVGEVQYNQWLPTASIVKKPAGFQTCGLCAETNVANRMRL